MLSTPLVSHEFWSVDLNDRSKEVLDGLQIERLPLAEHEGRDVVVVFVCQVREEFGFDRLRSGCSPCRWRGYCSGRGRPWRDAIAEAIARHPAHESNIHAYVDRWAEMIPGAIEEPVEVLEQLRERNVRLLALTN